MRPFVDRYAWIESRSGGRRTDWYHSRSTSIVDVLGVSCPKCLSKAGERCMPRRIGSHLERLLAAGGRPNVR